MNYIVKKTPYELKDELDTESKLNNSLLIDNSQIDFIKIPTSIYIPSKLEFLIENYIPKEDLRFINKDFLYAKEMIYLFVSHMTFKSYFEYLSYKNINIEKFTKKYFNINNKFYRDKTLKIIDILIKGTSTGPIIECDNKYYSGEKSRGYRLTEKYIKKGWIKYDIKNEKLKNMLMKHYYLVLSKTTKNIIARNLLFNYSHIDLPTIKEIEKEGRRLIKTGYKNKDGKELRFKKDKKKINREKYTYVEDAIDRFKFLTDGGYMIPIFKDGENICGRVVDSFTLMNSWIRNLIKIDGYNTVEIDFTALHPNIASMLYDSKLKYINHQDISEELNIDIKKVKKLHLSFFNYNLNFFKSSKLFNYYYEKDPDFIERIIKDKQNYGYKITTIKLFNIEVKLMSNIIDELDKNNIRCLYIYDALLVSQKDLFKTKHIMNNNAIKMNIYTNVK